EFDAPVKDEVDEIRVPPGARFDHPERGEVLLVSTLAPFQQAERLLSRQRVGEEETQERLVAVLDGRRRAVEPVRERLTARVCELVHATPASAVRAVLAADESLLLELPQLGIDLPIARRPEEARRAVDGGLDVVAGHWPELEQSEHDRSDRRLLHVARRYIVTQYLSSQGKGRPKAA